jgi:hypothetical protein
LGEVFHRLEAELQIHGFDTVTIVSERSDAATLSAQVSKVHALAAIAVVERGRSAALEICVVDRATGQINTRTLEPEARDEAPSLLAVRAADLLRANQEPAPPPAARPKAARRPATPRAASRDEDEPEEEPERDVSRERPRFWLSAEANMLHAGARFGLAFGPQLGLWYWPNEWLALGLSGAGPLSGSLNESLGTALLRQELFWLEARVLVLRVGPLSFAPLAGAGVYFLQAEGSRVNEPLRPRSAALWNWLGHLGLRVDVELLAHLSLGAALRVRALVPGVVIAVANEAERMNVPVLDASLGIAVGF